MLQLSYKFGKSKCNPYYVIVLKSAPGTNNVLNKHGNIDQY